MTVPSEYRDAVRFSFGDSPSLADELLDLVLAGKKTATCGKLSQFGEGGEAMPEVGRRDVVLDGQGRPAAVIETIEVTVKRFDKVDEAFARDEGEGDGTLAYWRDAHETYFARNGGFASDVQVVCERFKLIQVLNR